MRNFCNLKAERVYEKIKSPAGLRKSPATINILRGDDFKGYERILRELTSEMNLPFSEYWGFLDHYLNLKSPEGLCSLEIYLRQKKLIGLIDGQLKLAQVILNDRLNNNSGHERDAEDTGKRLAQKLDEFVLLTCNLRDVRLDLKENQLSHRFERFVKAAADVAKTDLQLLLIGARYEAGNGLSDDDLSIYESVAKYMTAIIELCRLDSSSKCYFNLYKTSKHILELLNCNHSFEEFYLSPVFKNFSKKSQANSTQDQTNSNQVRTK